MISCRSRCGIYPEKGGTALNILVTLDRGYLHQLAVMLSSLLIADPAETYDVYLMNASLRPSDFEKLTAMLGNRCRLTDVRMDSRLLAEAPVTDRYPQEMYYRIFAAQYLPQTLDRILYLDPDLVVRKPLRALYETDMTGQCFAAASHVRGALKALNAIRLGERPDEMGPYINSGVMLMNLARLRETQDEAQVLDYIRRHQKALLLPDQDIISALYAGQIRLIDARIYNMTERLLVFGNANGEVTPHWVAENSAVIHYCGRNKPWKPHYTGKLGIFYEQAEQAANPPAFD